MCSSVVLEEKSRRVFDKARGKPGNKMVPISNTQNLCNKIMGFVDLDDLLVWFYRSNGYRERKYWWPVYIWTIRKRVDKAFQARLIAYEKALRTIDEELSNGRIGNARRTALEAEKKEMKRRKPNHFDHIEACVGYHILKVRCSFSTPTPTRCGGR